MRTSRDVVFDESRPFYLHFSSDASPASLVDPLSLLLFPDAPPTTLPIPRSILPSFVSSFESRLVVPDYMVEPLVTQFYSRGGARLSDASPSSDELSFDVPSSFVEDVPSSPSVELSSSADCSPEQLIRCSHRLRRPLDYYSLAFTTTALFELAFYHDATLNLE
jgi:hypothetical protein